MPLRPVPAAQPATPARPDHAALSSHAAKPVGAKQPDGTTRSGGAVARPDAKATEVKRPNCGSGAGGFKPGNVCGNRNRAAHAAKLQAARKAAKDQGEHAAHEVRQIARELRQHRRGHAGAISNNAARWSLDALKAVGQGKASAGLRGKGKPDAKPPTGPQPRPEPKPEPKPQPKPQPEPVPAPKPDAKPEPIPIGSLDLSSDSAVAGHVRQARRAIAAATVGVPSSGSIAARIDAHAGGEAARRAVIEVDDEYGRQIAALQDRHAKDAREFKALDKKLSDMQDHYIDQSAIHSIRSPRMTGLSRDIDDAASQHEAIKRRLREVATRADRLNARRLAHIHAITSTTDGVPIDHDFAGEGVARMLAGKQIGEGSRRAVATAHRFIASQFAAASGDKTRLTPIYFHVDPRAFCRDFESKGTRASMVNLDRDNEQPYVVVHELGHAIEHQFPGVGRASREFLAHRVGDEVPRPMSQLNPGPRYSASEMGREDDFRKAFGRSAGYVGKDYGDRGTEILSMGIQKYYQDPAHLARTDPEFFKYVHGVLSGAIR